MASSICQSSAHNIARVIIGARCTPAAQCTYNLFLGSFSACTAKSVPHFNSSGGFGANDDLNNSDDLGIVVVVVVQCYIKIIRFED